MTDHLVETHRDGITTLTLNRPESRNALSPQMIAALTEALPRLAADRSVRVVVITGAGGAFCSGGDVKRFASEASPSAESGREGFDLEDRVHALRSRMEMSRHLHEMPKPTLAVIPGAAAGAGLSLALACDLRIAAETAKLTTGFARVGLSGDWGGSYGSVATSGRRLQDGRSLTTTGPDPPSCPATIRSNGVSSNQDSSSCVFGGTCGMP